MDFWLTQVMSGHGKFNKYLFRMKISLKAEYSNCDIRGRDDNTWHTLFECPTYQKEREMVQAILREIGGEPLTSTNMVLLMLRSTRGWDLVAPLSSRICGTRSKQRGRGKGDSQPPSTSIQCRASPSLLLLPITLHRKPKTTWSCILGVALNTTASGLIK